MKLLHAINDWAKDRLVAIAVVTAVSLFIFSRFWD